MKKNLCLIAALCAVGAAWAASWTDPASEITWNCEAADGGITLGSPSVQPVGACVLPETVAGKPVTALGAGAFAGCASLTSVTLPAGLLRIGTDAFAGCPLRAVTVEGSPKADIPAGTFGTCTVGYYPAGQAPLWKGIASWNGLTMYPAPEAENLPAAVRDALVKREIAERGLKTPAEVAAASANAEKTAVGDALASGDVCRSDALQDLTFGAPSMEVGEKEVTVTVSLQTSADMKDWLPVALKNAKLEVVNGKLRLSVPKPDRNAKFYRFVSPAK